MKDLLEACKWMAKELNRLNDICGQNERISQQLEVVNNIIISYEQR